MNKRTEAQRKAESNYMVKHGLVQYARKIKPEWISVLDEMLKKLRSEK